MTELTNALPAAFLAWLLGIAVLYWAEKAKDE